MIILTRMLTSIATGKCKTVTIKLEGKGYQLDPLVVCITNVTSMI